MRHVGSSSGGIAPSIAAFAESPQFGTLSAEKISSGHLFSRRMEAIDIAEVWSSEHPQTGRICWIKNAG
jgi:hypothetical protein